MGLGFMIMMGNVSGFGGSYLFISSEAPRYPTAYGVSLGLLCVAIVASIGLDYVYWTINKRRQAMTPAEAYRRAMAHAQAKITPPSSQDDAALGDLIDLTDELTIRQQEDTALPSALQELQVLMVHRPPTRDQTTEGCADPRTKQTATATEETLTASSPCQAIFEALECSEAAFSARDL